MVEYIIAGAGVAIAGHFLKKKRPQIKGYIGEVKLARAVKRLGLPGTVKVMRDSLFYGEKGGTSQIDVLAVTRYGILIFENKNYRCDIYGTIDDMNWRCMYPRGDYVPEDPFDYGNKKHKYSSREPLYNPVLQNKSHISAVSSVLREKYPGVPCFPLVVFSDSARLFVQNSPDKGCKLNQLGKVIPRLVGEEILTDNQVNEIAGILEKNQIKGRRARKNHVTTVKLGIEAHKMYSAEDLAKVEAAYRRSAENKPVWTAQGDRLPQDKSTSESFGSRPLSEIIQTAQSRTGGQEQSQNSRPGKSFSR